MGKTRKISLLTIALFVIGQVCAQEVTYKFMSGPITPPAENYSSAAKAPMLWDTLKTIAEQDGQHVLLVHPPVMDQGAEESCAAFAFGYCALSILSYDKYLNMDDAQRSPWYFYEKVRQLSLEDATISEGSGLANDKVFETLRDIGCCSHRLYSHTNDTILQNNDAKCHTSRYVDFPAPNSTDLLKQQISRGYPIIIQFVVNEYLFDIMKTSGNVYSDSCLCSPHDTNRLGWHSCCIVGYNDMDSVFIVQNSYGTGCGHDGFLWLKYNLVDRGFIQKALWLYNLQPSFYIDIQGTDVLCDSAEYILVNKPQSATLQWSYQGEGNPIRYPSKVYFSGNQDTTICQRGEVGGYNPYTNSFQTKPFSGNVTLTATATLLNGYTKTVYKEVSVNKSQHPVIENTENARSQYVNLREIACDVVDSLNIEWQLMRLFPGLGQQQTSVYGKTARFKKISTAQTVTIINHESCSADSAVATYLILPQPRLLSMQFNSVAEKNSQLLVTLVDDISGDNADDIETTPIASSLLQTNNHYKVELWSSLDGYQSTTDIMAEKVYISLDKLRAGIYYLQLIENDLPIEALPLVIR